MVCRSIRTFFILSFPIILHSRVCDLRTHSESFLSLFKHAPLPSVANTRQESLPSMSRGYFTCKWITWHGYSTWLTRCAAESQSWPVYDSCLFLVVRCKMWILSHLPFSCANGQQRHNASLENKGLNFKDKGRVARQTRLPSSGSMLTSFLRTNELDASCNAICSSCRLERCPYRFIENHKPWRSRTRGLDSDIHVDVSILFFKPS